MHIKSFWGWSTRKGCVTCVTHIFQIFFKINFFKISLWKLKVGFIFLGFDPIPSITLGFAFWQQSIYEFITCFLRILNLRICLFFSRNFMCFIFSKLCNQVRSLSLFRWRTLYSAENIKRLCVFMFQTCSNSLICTDSQYSSQ